MFKTTKKVNIYPRRPLMFGKFEIRREAKGITMTVGNIYNSLLAGAKIEEVFDDGTIVKLNTSNYKKDNTPTAPPEDSEAKSASVLSSGMKSNKTTNTNPMQGKKEADSTVKVDEVRPKEAAPTPIQGKKEIDSIKK